MKLEWTRYGCLSHSKTHWKEKIQVDELRRQGVKYRNIYTKIYSTLFLAYITNFLCTFITGTKSLKISPQSNLHNFNLCIFCKCNYLFLLEFPFSSASHQSKWMGECVVSYLWQAGGVLIYFHSSPKLTHWQPGLFCSHDKCPINRRCKPVKCANSGSTQGERGGGKKKKKKRLDRQS